MYPCIWIYNLQFTIYNLQFTIASVFLQLYFNYYILYSQMHKYIYIYISRERESEIDVTDRIWVSHIPVISPFWNKFHEPWKLWLLTMGVKSVNSRLPMSKNTVGIANLKCAVNFWPLWLLWVQIVAVPSCIGAGKILGPMLETCWSWSVVGASFDKIRNIQA